MALPVLLFEYFDIAPPVIITNSRINDLDGFISSFAYVELTISELYMTRRILHGTTHIKAGYAPQITLGC